MSSSTAHGQADERRAKIAQMRLSGIEPYKDAARGLCGRLHGVSKKRDGSQELHVVFDGNEHHLAVPASLAANADALKRGDIIACELHAGTLDVKSVETVTPALRKPVAVKSDPVAMMLLDDSIASKLRARAKIVSALRYELDALGFTEVETRCAMSAGHCGAAARPMIIKRQARNETLSLRVATEPELKRLVIGGMDKIYEIGRVFRDEGDDATHQPEFTSLELYHAGCSMQRGLALAEELLSAACRAVLPSDELAHARRVATMRELVAERGFGCITASDTPSAAEVSELQKIVVGAESYGAALEALFDADVAPSLTGVTIVTRLPRSSSPLSRQCGDHLAERFELYIGSTEIMNGCLEQTDPDELRRALRAQPGGLTSAGEQLCRDTELGMPPTFGLGIGVDRLVAAVLGASSIASVMALRC